MKAWWKIQSGRINALSLRERAFLFVTLIICLLALADTLWKCCAVKSDSRRRVRAPWAVGIRPPKQRVY